jgi:hypothetical protein
MHDEGAKAKKMVILRQCAVLFYSALELFCKRVIFCEPHTCDIQSTANVATH